MILPMDIGERLEEMLRAKFPDTEIYWNYEPKDFKRPCFALELEKCTGDVDFSTGGIELRPVFSITVFGAVDPYNHSDVKWLHLRQMQVAGMFLPGYIRVGDRAPKVAGLHLEGGLDDDAVTVEFRLALARKDFEELENAPLMEHIITREEVVTYG